MDGRTCKQTKYPFIFLDLPRNALKFYIISYYVCSVTYTVSHVNRTHNIAKESIRYCVHCYCSGGTLSWQARDSKLNCAYVALYVKIISERRQNHTTSCNALIMQSIQHTWWWWWRQRLKIRVDTKLFQWSILIMYVK